VSFSAINGDIGKSLEELVMAETWTVMFYFAGDNALSPAVVSQLKALTNAGWHERVNVVAQFDPNEQGVPTRVYEINSKRKAKGLGKRKKSEIGDGNDPFVHHLRPDLMSDTARYLSTSPDELTPNDALTGFLDYCIGKYDSDHYMLFLLGHGMIVANDSFLSDNYPDASISLAQFGNILRNFAHKVQSKGKSFDFVGLHSCSMSSLEVAYELSCEKELMDRALENPLVDAAGKPITQTSTAKYMMASQGIAFVGSWPYRNILVKLFNLLNGGQFDVKKDLLKTIPSPN
jgi:hypothetical protein